MISLNDYKTHKEAIKACVEKIMLSLNLEIEFISIMGSIVYGAYTDNDYEAIYKDLDILVVVKELNGNGNKNINYIYNRFSLDIQIIKQEKFLELVKDNHLFYLEALYAPKEFILKENPKYKKEFKLNESSLEKNTLKIIKETNKKAKNLFSIYAQINDHGAIVHANKLVWHSIRSGLMKDWLIKNHKELNTENSTELLKIANIYWLKHIEISVDDLIKIHTKKLPSDIFYVLENLT